jgi:hypothetical protein
MKELGAMTHFEELPGWIFSVAERSAGVYVALGVDRDGRSVQLVGEDPNELLARCREDAVAMARGTS